MAGLRKDLSEEGLKALKGVMIGLVGLTVALSFLTLVFEVLVSEEEAGGFFTSIGSTLCSITMCLGTFLIPLFIIYAIVKATMQNKGKRSYPGTNQSEVERLRKELEDLREKVEHANQLETAGSHVLAADLYGKLGLKGSAAMVNERMHKLKRMTGGEGAGLLEHLEREASKEMASEPLGPEGPAEGNGLASSTEVEPKVEGAARKKGRPMKMTHRPMVQVTGPEPIDEKWTELSVAPERTDGAPVNMTVNVGPEKRIVTCRNCRAASELDIVQGRPVVCPYCGANT